MIGSRDLCTFGGDEVVGFGGGFERYVVEEDVRVLLEDGGEFAKAPLPGVAVDDQGWRGGKQLCRGFFAGEVGGGIFFFGTDLLLGFDFEVAVERAAVAAVGGEPEAAGQELRRRQ